MLKRYERATEELPAEMARFARKAFVKSCELAYGVTVAIEDVMACTFRDDKGKSFLFLAWRTIEYPRTLATGRFDHTHTGGVLELFCLFKPIGTPVAMREKHLDTYISAKGAPVITGR